MLPYLLLLSGLIVMLLCGNWLVSGAVQIARHLKISTLVVGLTIVAFGTSTPEIFIGVRAVLAGHYDIALGNVIGSNIANISFILAIVALVCPIPLNDRKIAFDLTVMFTVTILMFIFGLNGQIGTLEGICFLLILLAYTFRTVVKSRKENAFVKTDKPTMKQSKAILMILVAFVGLYFSAEWFVDGARQIATIWGVSDRVIAISLVAVGTSMPELVISLIAIFKKQGDLSVGNIIGSNFFNIAGVLGITATVRNVNIADTSLFFTDMFWLLGVSVALVLAMMPLSKGKINRLEGFLLIAIFAVYMYFLFT